MRRFSSSTGLARGLSSRATLPDRSVRVSDARLDRRSQVLLAIAETRGPDALHACVEKQLAFSALPTTMIDCCSIAAALSVDIASGAYVNAPPLATEACRALLGASAASALFNIVHSNTLHTTLQYTAYSSDEARRGELLAEFVRRHGWRFDTLVNSQIATQSFAMGSLVLHGWLPTLGGAALVRSAVDARHVINLIIYIQHTPQKAKNAKVLSFRFHTGHSSSRQSTAHSCGCTHTNSST